MSSHEDLLSRAKDKTLTRDEYDQVFEALLRAETVNEKYTLLHVLGHSGDERYRATIEGFLACEDASLARLALQILCDFWGDVPRYIHAVDKFIDGSPFDVDGELRQAAVSIAGEYLRHNEDPAIARKIASLYDDAREDVVVRGGAYTAMLRAIGWDWGQIPSPAKLLHLEENVDHSAVKLFRERAAAG
jgi:hypothetical protein